MKEFGLNDEQLELAISHLNEGIRILYFDCILFCKDTNVFSQFKDFVSNKMVPNLIDQIKDKYVDHLEGRIKEF